MIENLYGEARTAPDPDPDGLSVVAGLANLAAPYAIRVAATLRIADLLADEPVRLANLAERAGADPDALERLMRFLICRGVFAEPEPGLFAMTDSAGVLTSDHPMGVRGWLDLDGPAASLMDASFTGLLHTVRTGQASYPEIFGRPAWEHLESEPEQAASFGKLMAGRAASFAPDIVTGYDWSTVKHVVDVGGGAGLVIAQILRSHETMRGTLVDLPALVAVAQQTFASAGLTDRATAVEGELFGTLPAGADVYLLASILHDWNDDDAASILAATAKAAGTSGRVLVVDRTSDHGNPLTFSFMNLLVLAFLGGRERSVAEFADLGAAAGLTLESATPSPAGLSLITFAPDTARG